jgi:hypothetical protein
VCPTKCLSMANGYTTPDTTRPPFANAFIQLPKATTPITTQTVAE